MIDMHVHYFPDKIFHAIWNYFEIKSKGLWNINYKITENNLISSLKKIGVSRFAGLIYAHKPGLAEYLNDFMFEAKNRVPEIIPFGTVFIGDKNLKQIVLKMFEQYDFYGIKLHPFVSNEQFDDPGLYPAYEIMQDMDKVLLVHAGSAPIFTDRSGPDRLLNVLNQFPSLKIIIAHFGAYEQDEFCRIAGEYENVFFDTAMIGVKTHVFTSNFIDREVYIKYQDRILFGSDFPNIPYDYSLQIDCIKNMDLPDEVQEKIFHKNAENLLGLVDT